MKSKNIKVGDIVTHRGTGDKWLVFNIQDKKCDTTTFLLCLVNNRKEVRRCIRGAFSAIYIKTKK